MSPVDIRVDLPSYSTSFTVAVEPVADVREVKEAIQATCPGNPRPEGQRLIWRGRLLADDERVENLWKSEPRIVHLAVHPSAWLSSPPEIPGAQAQPQSPTPRPILSSLPSYTCSPSSTYGPSAAGVTPPLAFTHLFLDFVIHKHQKALSTLSSSIPPPNDLVDPAADQAIAKAKLARNGWTWPEILDQEFPAPSEGGVSYETTTIENQMYLRLLNPEAKPTKIQEHALKVLTYTFTILTRPPSPSPPPLSLPRQEGTVPHVNQLLQQMGLPPLRVAHNNIIQANANGNPIIPEVREIRQIPIRPLLAPLIMLLLRTVLLLYFVAPARKPIFGILILAWMLYEIWQPIRNGLRNGWGRLPEAQPRAANGAGVAEGQNNAPQGNGLHNAAAGNIPHLPVRPNAVNPSLEQQAMAIFDTLANMNIAEEERIINNNPGTSNAEPGLGRKMAVFFGLLITTLHPAVWNRRRAALRRREGTVRTEANARNAPPLSTDGDSDSNAGPGADRAAQIREELREQYNRRPQWIKRYMERVVAEEWVDDSD